jgi:putative ABC transport system permease protein
MSRALHLLRLVAADIRYERVTVLCQALALAAVLVPLMVLLGLRAGVIGTLVERMDRDPAMRLILPDVTGANRFDADWFARWRARPDVAFVLPNTRAIAAQVDLVAPGGESLRVSLNPTGPGDPLGAGQMVTAEDALALTAEAARRLGLPPGREQGQTLMLLAERSRNGRIEPLARSFRVAAVLPPELAGGSGAYVTLPVLLAVQAFRDGYQVPELGVTEGNGPAPAVTAHPLFRLYARSIRDVAPLAEALRADGVQPATREGEIVSTLKLDASLKAVLAIIIAAAALGVAVSLLAGQLAALRRRRRDLAVLKLIGYGPLWLAGLPLGQVLAVVVLGGGMAVLLFFGAAQAINGFFAASLAAGEQACRLSAAELAACLGGALLAALPAGLAAGWQATKVDPAGEVRDV